MKTMLKKVPKLAGFVHCLVKIFRFRTANTVNKYKKSWKLVWLVSLVLTLPLLLVTVVKATHGPSGTLVWGYQATGEFGNAAMANYDIGTDAFVSSCVPASGAVPPHASGNGRGVVYDPSDGNLFYTVLNTGGFFAGDLLIHKTTPPPTCTDVGTPIPVPQDMGALDIDPDDGHIWAAGYQPIGGLAFFYKISKGPVPPAGTVMQSCNVPFGGGGTGNDTLALAKLSGLAGSGKYLLTDAGELLTALKVVDTAACVGGGGVVPVTTYTLPVGVAGIDYEPVGGTPELIASTTRSIVSLGSPPFAAVLATMSTAPVGGIEDITLKTAPIVINVAVDIHPQSCPNPLNTRSQGVTPAAILGTATFDVTKIDVSTVKLAGVSPLRSSLEDVATPFSPFTGKASCTADCNTLGPDGFLDLTLKFDTQALVAAIGTVTDGQCLVLKLTGKLRPAFGGTPIAGEDVVVILKKRL